MEHDLRSRYSIIRQQPELPCADRAGDQRHPPGEHPVLGSSSQQCTDCELERAQTEDAHRGAQQSEAFAPKTLDEVVRIAEVFLVHLGSPALETLTYVSRARAPAPQSLVSKNSSTFPKISGALFDS